MRIAFFMLIMGTMGCDDACEGLDEDACAANTACAAIDGLPVQQDSSGDDCVDYEQSYEFAGCAVADDSGCDDAMTPAADPSGDCTFYLPNSCLPDGWSTCETWTDYEQCEP